MHLRSSLSELYQLYNDIRTTWLAMSYTLATAGCVFSASTQLYLAPGVSSWGEAYEFLDPAGYSMQYGQAGLTSLIMAVFNYMISQNYEQGIFHLTREVLE
jgi:hypothetical protein